MSSTSMVVLVERLLTPEFSVQLQRGTKKSVHCAYAEEIILITGEILILSMSNNSNGQQPAQQQQIHRLVAPPQQGNLQALVPAIAPQYVLAPTLQQDGFDLIHGNPFLSNSTHTSVAPDFTKFLLEGDNNLCRNE
ncbi:5324_t:CDS:2 [Acaulospora morrowiae]|uniref:5324_t:CDS:1 n=1 Tax=Acaulospora morrowiae TaxID=94023 RepID=A0A9N9A1N2_9GLOM|nr:5324_t:CDS:2 [Acaulospora morrowiae]